MLLLEAIEQLKTVELAALQPNVEENEIGPVTTAASASSLSRAVCVPCPSSCNVAYANACRLERRPEIQDRICYLTRQEEGLVVEKRQRIEEALWNIHEADIGDYFETHDIDGKTIEQPKRLSDLPPEIRKNIEKITINGRGRTVPQLYSKLAASQELHEMLNIGGEKDRTATDVSRLSDAELIQQLTDQAKELGIEIDLSYRFAQDSDE
jgi:hypothetical protein